MSTVDTIRKTREFIRSWEERRMKMTISEAVELYNEVQDKIKRMDELMHGISERNRNGIPDPIHQNAYYVLVQEMEEIANFLTEYKTYLRQQLDATFEPGDTGNG